MLIVSAIAAAVRALPAPGTAPSLAWVAGLAYLVAAGLCGGAGRGGPRRWPGLEGRRIAHTWYLLALVLLGLGLVRAWGLDGMFTHIGREMAKGEGWYGQRRPLQFWLVLGLLAGGLGALAVSAFRTRAHRRELRLAVAGGIGLTTFFLIRAVSYHHVDQFLALRYAGISVNATLEISGILLVAGPALRRLTQRPHPPAPPQEAGPSAR